MTIRRFEDNPTNDSRALQCHLILIGCAARRQTVTYGELAERLGYKKADGGPGVTGGGVIGNRLAPLMFWCKQNNLPALTSLVVREDTGMPGLGIYLDPSEVPSAQEKVYAFDWYAIVPPTVEQLDKAYAKGKHEATTAEDFDDDAPLPGSSNKRYSPATLAEMDNLIKKETQNN